VKEYEVYVPVFYNDGTRIERDKRLEIHRRLLNEFEGMTFFSQPTRGYWKFGGVTFRDRILIYRTLAPNALRARRFLRELKDWMKVELQQEAILITEKSVKRL
jgi:hypothetical protein